MQNCMSVSESNLKVNMCQLGQHKMEAGRARLPKKQTEERKEMEGRDGRVLLLGPPSLLALFMCHCLWIIHLHYVSLWKLLTATLGWAWARSTSYPKQRGTLKPAHCHGKPLLSLAIHSFKLCFTFSWVCITIICGQRKTVLICRLIITDIIGKVLVLFLDIYLWVFLC